MDERIASLGEDRGRGELREEPKGVEGQVRPTGGKAVPTPGLHGASVRGSALPCSGMLTAERPLSCLYPVPDLG